MAASKSAPSVPDGRPRKRFAALLKGGPVAVVAAIIFGVAAGGGATEGIDAAAGSASNSTVMTGQVACPSYGTQAISVTDMQFQMSDGKAVSATLSPITDANGGKTNWDHYSAYVPASAAGGYVARVTCERQKNWTPRITGTASRTITCGVVDGECRDTIASLPSASISQAHPPYQKGFPGGTHPEPLHTPES
jgi:hypothetical protein